MKSHSIFSRASLVLPKAGFTLIEVIVVIAIFATLLALGVFMSLAALRGAYHRSETATVVGLLETARSRAMANMFQTEWGFAHDESMKQYVIFRGSTYNQGATTNEITAANPDAEVKDGSNSPDFKVVFDQLSGDTSPETITVEEGGKTSTININEEGTILW